MTENINWCTDTKQLKDSNCDSDEAFKRLSEAFNLEPHLLKADPENLKRSFDKGLAIIGLNAHGQIIGYARLTPLTPGWFELGGTFIDPAYRGLGLNHQMYQTFLPFHRDKNILATTTNPTSLQVGKDLGFVTIPRHSLPENVWRSSCTCPTQKTGATDPRYCRLASKPDCFFRITPETATRLRLNPIPDFRRLPIIFKVAASS